MIHVGCVTLERNKRERIKESTDLVEIALKKWPHHYLLVCVLSSKTKKKKQICFHRLGVLVGCFGWVS